MFTSAGTELDVLCPVSPVEQHIFDKAKQLLIHLLVNILTHLVNEWGVPSKGYNVWICSPKAELISRTYETTH